MEAEKEYGGCDVEQENTKRLVESAVAVDRMKIAAAKEYIRSNLQESVPNLIEGFLRQQGQPCVRQLKWVHPTLC